MPGVTVITVAVCREIHNHVLICQINLNGTDIRNLFQINRDPLAGSGISSAPPGADILVHGLFGVAAGGNGDRLFVGQQHPLRLQGSCIESSLRNTERIVRKILVAVQDAVLIKACREQSYPTLKGMIDTDAHGGNVPVVSELICNGAAMASACGKPTGLRGEGVALLQMEGAKRAVCHINTITIGIKFGSGSCVLKIVFTIMLGHERTLNVGLSDGIKYFLQSLGVVAHSRSHAWGNLNFSGLGIHMPLQVLIECIAFFVHFAIVAETLIA